jgi:hypothetical protein
MKSKRIRWVVIAVVSLAVSMLAVLGGRAIHAQDTGQAKYTVRVPNGLAFSEAAAGDRADAAAGVLHDLRLLIGIQPGGRADDEARRLQRMLPDVDLGLLGKQVAEDVLEGGLDEGKVRVVRDYCLRERGELYPCWPSSWIFRTTFSTVPSRL